MTSLWAVGGGLTGAYFETEEGTVWDEPTTYTSSADGEEATFANTVTHEWNHGLGEIVTALLTHGFEITALVEHRDFAKGGEVLYR